MDLLELDEKASKIEKDILRLARNTILVHLRFMDIAVSRLREERLDCGSLATDGERICYDRKALFDSYRVGREKVARDCLHLLLHCIFRHMYIHAKINAAVWDLATDIAVENCINELADNAFTCSRQFGQAAIIDQLREEIGTLTAERIYRYLIDREISESDLYEMRQNFCGDSHILWYMDSNDDGDEQGRSDTGSQSEGQGDSSRKEEAERSSDSEKTGKTNDNENNAGDDNEESSEGNENGNNGKNNSKNNSGNEPESEKSESEDHTSENNENNSFLKEENTDDSGQKDNDDAAELSESTSEKAWHDISDKIRQDLENFSKEQGSRAGSLMQNIRSVNRERYDYGAFLRRFASRCEVMRLNDDEFDYLFYTYGLKNYGNMPLIEPLEYKDAKVVREFVIVIDTSGSVQGEVVQKFIQKTYNILHQEESFRKRFVLHIIQCDAKVQEDTVIRSRDEMEIYLKSMQIHGLGGTDFRPAFQHVDDLVRKAELKHLRGMVYFTDGYGAFPSNKPFYETAFVFLDENENNTEVPPWAIRLVLRPEDIA